MKIDAALIETLLYEEEGPTIDFKKEEYPFSRATDDEKGEMLKDLLSFANGWRRSDAFILLGVEELRGGRCIVKGISEVYDDAHIQQFVNSKTQRPLIFSFQVVQMEGLKIGVFHIPLQERPIYLKRDFGKLKKDQVIIRRGTSTSIADPDEISKMRVSDQNSEIKIPHFQLEFLDLSDNKSIGKSVSLEVSDLIKPSPENIPDYGFRNIQMGEVTLKQYDSFSNKDFYKEVINYWYAMAQVKKVGFSIINTSETVGLDVKVEIRIPDRNNDIILFDEYEKPLFPDDSKFASISRLTASRPTYDTTVEKRNDEHIVVINFGKVQPKRTEPSNGGIYIGATKNTDFEFSARIFSDNLPNPVEQNMAVSINVHRKEMEWEKILSKYGNQ